MADLPRLYSDRMLSAMASALPLVLNTVLAQIIFRSNSLDALPILPGWL